MHTKFLCSLLNCSSAKELRNKIEIYKAVLLHNVTQDDKVFMKIPFDEIKKVPRHLL